MKMKAVLFVLLSAVLTGAAHGQTWKKYIFVNLQLNWTDAQTYCRENYQDLAIIQTGEWWGFNTSVASQCDTVECWIGLRWNEIEQKFFWSNGQVSDYASAPSDPNYCGCSYYGYTDCKKTLNFVCYVWESSLVAVQEMKTWEEALIYCRKHYTDLVRIVTESDHTAVNITSSDIQTSSFWTGLRFLDGSWFWVSRTDTLKASRLGKVSSMSSCPAPRFRCGARSTKSYVLEARDCEEKLNFMCHTGTRHLMQFEIKKKRR